MTPLRIFIGVDDRELVAYHVLAHSLLARASCPIAIVPLKRSLLARVHTRAKGPTESTDFAFTRFLVPYLSNFEGVSIFMDCDMLAQVDIGDVMLHVLAYPDKAVYVCQHDYTPRPGLKFLGQAQTIYPRKNWSSLIVFNNARCKALTPEYVNTASGLDLHRFLWLDDSQVGSLPLTWNHLVGEYDPNPAAKILHYTLGGPWFADSAACDQADLWRAEYAAMTAPMAA
jgi:hypothetical protein